MRQLLRALSAVLVLLAIALASALITMRVAIHGAEIGVPALSGLSLSQTVAKTHAHGLETAIDGRFYSTTQPAGHVITQSPAPGTLVRKSWRVRVALSLGPQKTAIPALEGMDESIGTITIRRIGLQVGDVAAIPYEDAPEEYDHRADTASRRDGCAGPGHWAAERAACSAAAGGECHAGPDRRNLLDGGIDHPPCRLSTGPAAERSERGWGHGNPQPANLDGNTRSPPRRTGARGNTAAQPVLRASRHRDRTGSRRGQPHSCGSDGSAYRATMMRFI